MLLEIAQVPDEHPLVTLCSVPGAIFAPLYVTYYRPTVQQRKQAVFHLLGIPLASKPEMNSYVKIHPKVSHGWTVRYSIDDPEAVKAAEEAHKEMLDWFVT
ncbi:unnamed protein product [Arabidopsis lyrata]|nr:unnamed protein product [Arabidopsis lyrata]